jgi:hypothetical protein
MQSAGRGGSEDRSKEQRPPQSIHKCFLNSNSPTQTYSLDACTVDILSRCEPPVLLPLGCSALIHTVGRGHVCAPRDHGARANEVAPASLVEENLPNGRVGIGSLEANLLSVICSDDGEHLASQPGHAGGGCRLGRQVDIIRNLCCCCGCKAIDGGIHAGLHNTSNKEETVRSEPLCLNELVAWWLTAEDREQGVRGRDAGGSKS